MYDKNQVRDVAQPIGVRAQFFVTTEQSLTCSNNSNNKWYDVIVTSFEEKA